MTKTRKIITVMDDDFYKVMNPCDLLSINELEDARQIAMELRNALISKLPNIDNDPPTHDRPAYLAANQIGLTKAVLFLYLPPTSSKKASELVLFNPSISRVQPQVNCEEQFRISTFFADQLRFSNRCYAAKIEVKYQDKFGINQEIEFTGLEAIAAQMGVNFIHGITPLDHEITPDLLHTFAINPNQGGLPLKTTHNAYMYHKRPINSNSEEFASNPKQLEYIERFQTYRQNNLRIDNSKGVDPNQAYSIRLG